MSFLSHLHDDDKARVRAINRKRRDAVYRYLSTTTFKPERPLNERLNSETVEAYAFRMKLYRFVIGRYVLPRVVDEIDAVKKKEKGLKHDAVDRDEVRLTKSLLISDRARLLGYMRLIDKNLESVRGVLSHAEHKSRVERRVKADLDRAIKDKLFTPDASDAWL